MPDSSSEADAETVMVPLTVEPLVGEVIDTVGAVVSAVVSATAFDTVTDICALDSAPAPLNAVALSTWLPSESVVVSRLVLYGDVLSVAFRTLST
jgi:hypothetical protein